MLEELAFQGSSSQPNDHQDLVGKQLSPLSLGVGRTSLWHVVHSLPECLSRTEPQLPTTVTCLVMHLSEATVRPCITFPLPYWCFLGLPLKISNHDLLLGDPNLNGGKDGAFKARPLIY